MKDFFFFFWGGEPFFQKISLKDSIFKLNYQYQMQTNCTLMLQLGGGKQTGIKMPRNIGQRTGKWQGIFHKNFLLLEYPLKNSRQCCSVLKCVFSLKR